MKAQKHQLLLLLMLFFSWGYAQKSKLKEAEKHYDKQAYIKTSDILLKVAEKGYKSVDLFKKLGNSYYFNNQMTDAVKWYGT